MIEKFRFGCFKKVIKKVRFGCFKKVIEKFRFGCFKKVIEKLAKMKFFYHLFENLAMFFNRWTQLKILVIFAKP